MKKYNCGIIGLGRIGCGFDDNPKKTSISTHAGAYSKSNHANLVALCDIDKKKLAKYGKKYHVSGVYTDLNKMFQKENLDCISICTLSNTHLDIVKSATNYSIKGIFVEKPISDNLQNAKKIIEICRQNNVKLQVDHQRRFEPLYHKIKNFIDQKKIGVIQRMNVNYVAGIANTGSHFFDLLRYLVGEVEWVKGQFSGNASNNPSDPNIDGVLKFKNGVFCNINAFDIKNFRIFELDIIGSKGRIVIDLTESTARYFQVDEIGSGVKYTGLKQKAFSVKKPKAPILLGVENLLNSIKNNSENLCKGEDGYASLEAILAMKNSAKNNGKLIHLPLKNKTDKISSR